MTLSRQATIRIPKKDGGTHYSEQETLSYEWRHSPTTLTDLPKFMPHKYSACYCYSIVASQLYGHAQLPSPLGLPDAPFYVRWKDSQSCLESIHVHKLPCHISSLLAGTALTSWEKLVNAYGEASKTLGSLKNCTRAPPEELTLEYCTVEFGILYDYKLLKHWHEFSKEENMIFAEIKCASGKWYSACRRPLHLSIGDSKESKAEYILAAFRWEGYGNVAERFIDFWKQLQVTSCAVTCSRASMADYEAAAHVASQSLLQNFSPRQGIVNSACL